MKNREMILLTAAAVLLIPMTMLLQPGTAVQAAAQPGGTQQKTGEPAPEAPQQESPVLEEPPAEPEQTGIYSGAPGYFKILDQTTGKVDKVAAEDFVRGAVAAEMPALYHPEALKAQAVAAYTYAVYHALEQRENPTPELQGADFEADPQNLKVYLTEAEAKAFYGDDFDLYWNKVCQAADAAGQYILLYQGQPAAAAYHAISAGITEDARYIWDGRELPYLQAVDSQGDLLAAGYESTVTFTAQELRQMLSQALPGLQLPENQSRWVVPLEYSPSGYVTLVQVGEQNITGLELRFILGLRSSHFQVEQQNGVFTFTVQGYGHGAGLSQNGADYMARQGASFDEILLHYYPGVTLALSAAES